MQVFHEFAHGLAAVLVGAQWRAFNLFMMLGQWPGAANEIGTLIIEANLALLNIATGFGAIWLFGRAADRRQSIVAL